MLLGAVTAIAGVWELPVFLIQLLGLAFTLAVFAWVYRWLPRGPRT